MLLVAATLLSLSPLVVTFLHVLVGLRWRANSLLGRLDTVLELSIRDKKNLRTRKNLENQLIELHYQVRGFASASKIQEMAEIHRKMPGAPESSVFGVIYGDNGEDGIEKSHKGGRSLKGWRKTSSWNDLRYHLPAGFLCIIYFIGFLMVLVWYSTIATPKKAETPAQPAAMVQTQTVQTQAAPPPDKANDSGANLSLKRSGHPPSDTGEAAQGTSEGAAQGTPGAKTGSSGGAAGGEASQSAAPATTASAPPPTKDAILAAQRTPAAGSDTKLNCSRWVACWIERLRAFCKSEGRAPPSFLIYAFLGSFVFNTGIMVRRIFVWDISGQMFWWAAYRVILSLGLAGVLRFTTPGLDPHFYFLLATASVAVFDNMVRGLRAKLFQSETAPKRNELSLQLVQGIDYWKEQRLLEEGIESVQHLATSDFVLLALYTRTPLYTIVDWVDQAIFIQRFPGKADRMADAGLPVSAVELTWGWDPANREGFENRRPRDGELQPANDATKSSYTEYLGLLADAAGTKPGVVARTFDAWSNDNQVQLLTLFWKADLGGE
jgi:hypothetical protein